MKKIKLFALALMALMTANTWAVTPNFSVESCGENDFNKLIGTFNNITISSSYTSFKGNLSGSYYIAISSSGEYSKNYFQISATSYIDSIAVFWAPNGEDATNIAWIAWEEKTTPSTEVTYYGTTEQYTGKKALTSAIWQTIDLSGKKVLTMQFARCEKNITCGGKSVSQIGLNKTVNVLGLKVWLKDDAKYPYVKSFTMGEIEAVVDTAAKTITAELPYGTNRTDAISNAVVNMGGTAKTYSISGDVLTAIDSTSATKNIDYNLSGITVKSSASTDATLKSLSINGTAIKDFSADVYEYNHTLKYTETALPILTAELNDATAQMNINDVTEIPGAGTVVVTAQDGTTKLTYTVNFTRATADKTLYEVVFSNGAKGAIDNTNATIIVPYLGGTDIPTLVSDSVSVGATAQMTGDKLTVVGIDMTEKEFSIEFIALSIPAFKADTITFDSTETYIYAYYGWDSGKGWKFAKAVNDASNMRITEGKTRIYMALPALYKVNLISGSGGARDIKVSVNNGTATNIKTGAKNAGVDILLSTTQTNFIAIESNQTSGDGGFIKMVMTETTPTQLSEMMAGKKAEKFILDGKVYFRHGEKIFNALGQEILF